MDKVLQDIKRSVTLMINEREQKGRTHIMYPNDLWSKWMSFLSFIFEFSPEMLKNIRLHTGLGYFLGKPWTTEFWENKEYKCGLRDYEQLTVVKDYSRLIRGIPEKYWCSEIIASELVEEICTQFKGRNINGDICRAQATMSNLFIAKVFSKFLNDGSIILEIGQGYGQLGNQLSSMVNCRVVCIDQPEILYWCAVFTHVCRPGTNIYVYSPDKQNVNICDIVTKYDFVLLPAYRADLIYDMDVDLVINENSFGEMTEKQVSYYLDIVKQASKMLYSNNYEKQFMNRNLASVGDMLSRIFLVSPTKEQYAEYYGQDPSPHRKYIYFCYNDKADYEVVDILSLRGLDGGRMLKTH